LHGISSFTGFALPRIIFSAYVIWYPFQGRWASNHLVGEELGMSRRKHLANAVERTINGPLWHGPSLQELLADVSAEDASAHPLVGVHSIWEVVLHVIAWAEIAKRRLEGETGEPAEAQNWPPVPAPTQDAWTVALAALARSHHDLARAVEQFDEAGLSAILPGRNHSAQVMLQGVVEHGAYHGGQIALLKKALGRTKT
jgi:uncharacterized damage-inducible protein DinB